MGGDSMLKYLLLIVCITTTALNREPLPQSLQYLGYQAPVPSRIPPHHYAALKKRIAEGRDLLTAVLAGSRTPPFDLMEHFEQIVSLMWGVYDMAVEKDGPFWDGTIVLVDPHERLFSFLKEYAHTLWQKDSHTPRYATTQCHGYPRHSSHFPESKNIQWGIDMRSPEGSTLEKLLPTAKRHLLFGRLSHNRTFIKFEEYGLCVQDGSIISHGLGYVQSVVRKAIRMNDGRYTRREDVPYSIEKMYQKLVKKSASRGYKLEKSPIGIAEMVQEATSLLNSKSLHKRAHKFINEIESTYDFIEIRRGNEVIISPECNDFKGEVLKDTHCSRCCHPGE